MRERDFRGKRLDNGVWVYGDLHIKAKTPHIHDCFARSVHIDPATVGQYTGMKDKKGTKIYEGDIIKLDSFNPPLFVVDFVEGAFCLKQDDYGYYTDIHYVQHAGINQAEIIGNIHDNPELIKKGE